MTHRKRAIRYRTPVADTPAARLLVRLMDAQTDPTARSYEGMAHYLGMLAPMVQQRATGTRGITMAFANRVALALGDRVVIDGRKKTAREIAEMFRDALAERDETDGKED